MLAVFSFIPQGMGWIPDLPDPRDYTYRHEAVASLLERLKSSPAASLPEEVDLRRDDDAVYFSPPQDQGPLNCSASFAVLSLIEYFERRILGKTFDGSARFLYKITRKRRNKLYLVSGDTGADLRTTFKALLSTGVPPEEHWPYDVDKFDDEPDAFLYSLARPFKDIAYFRLDEVNGDGSTTWETLKSFLAAGFPVAFGFSVPTSLTTDPNIPCRIGLDGVRGGQAIVAVGYKNNHFGPGQHALLVRSSWGSRWGSYGNGWLPVTCLRHRLAKDFWTVVSEAWLNSDELVAPIISKP